MENFTPYSAFLGGGLIGLSVTLLLLFNGRVAGISGIMKGLVYSPKNEKYWRAAFLGGLILGAYLFNFLEPDFSIPRQNDSMGLLIVGGFLVGFGTRMGNGCTSGHGVCGIARFSLRSIVATITFMASAMIAVFILRHAGGL